MLALSNLPDVAPHMWVTTRTCAPNPPSHRPEGQGAAAVAGVHGMASLSLILRGGIMYALLTARQGHRYAWLTASGTGDCHAMRVAAPGRSPPCWHSYRHSCSFGTGNCDSGGSAHSKSRSCLGVRACSCEGGGLQSAVDLVGVMDLTQGAAACPLFLAPDKLLPTLCMFRPAMCVWIVVVEVSSVR